MRSTFRVPTLVGLRALLAAGGAFAIVSFVGPAEAQVSPDPAPPAADPRVAPPKQPPGPAKPILPKQRSDGARSLDRLPHTAEEKRRQLSDLYAQLATAEDENAAARFTSGIERLWRLSGSDTVNLLVSRGAKMAGEKRNELAEQLFDRAVALAPDYTEAFNQRALFFYSQNNVTAAVGDLRRVLALDPNHFKAMEGLVQIWRDTGNKKAAFEVLKQLLEVNPFAPGAKQAYDELKVEVEGRGI